MSALPLGIADNAKPWTGQPDAQISFTASPSTTANETVYTFSSVAIGDEDASRVVAVAFFVNGLLDELVSATIAGVEATKVSSIRVAGGGNAIAIFYAPVPTGTTATISVTCPDEGSRCATAVYRIIPAYGREDPISSDAKYESSVTLREVAGGVSIWCAVTPSLSSAYTVNRDSSALTTDISSTYSGSSLVKAGHVDISGTTNTAFNATYSSTSNDIVIATANWR